MSTKRFDSSTAVDLGAQYFSIKNQLSSSIARLIKDGLLLETRTEVWKGFKSSSEDVKQFVAPFGSSSIVKSILPEASDNLKLEYDRRLVRIATHEDAYVVQPDAGISLVYDAIILTIPVPQILTLEQSVFATDIVSRLKCVEYSSRFALGAVFHPEHNIQGPSVQYLSPDESPIFRYISLDNLRRKSNAEATCVVAHTSCSYGERFVETSPALKRDELLTELQRLFPQWPEAKDALAHKWRYSQVVKPFDGETDAVVLSPSPQSVKAIFNKGGLIVGAGDAFAGSSGLENCISSGETAAKMVIKYISEKK